MMDRHGFHMSLQTVICDWLPEKEQTVTTPVPFSHFQRCHLLLIILSEEIQSVIFPKMLN